MSLLLVCTVFSTDVRVGLCVVSGQGCPTGACVSCSVDACPDAFSLPWCVLFALPTCVCPLNACLPRGFGVLLLLICCVSCHLLRRHCRFIASLLSHLSFSFLLCASAVCFVALFGPFILCDIFCFVALFGLFALHNIFCFVAPVLSFCAPFFAACCAPFVAPIVGACCASLCLCALWLSCRVVGGCFP